MIIRFYRWPDLDARIGIYEEGDALTLVDGHWTSTRTHIAFLAKGSAYKGTGAARKLYKRNPDRTAAVDRLLPLLAPDSVRIGKTANGPAYVYEVGQTPTETLARARKAYSKGGNYRFDVLHVDALDPEAIGLVPCENRPVPLAFGGAS